jgi:hypothetical protein
LRKRQFRVCAALRIFGGKRRIGRPFAHRLLGVFLEPRRVMNAPSPSDKCGFIIAKKFAIWERWSAPEIESTRANNGSPRSMEGEQQ